MDRRGIYQRSFTSSLLKAFNDESALDRSILYGVRVMAADTNLDRYEEAIERFQLYGLIFELMKLITPRRLVTIFPIEKEYDGERWGMKDYFSSIEAINEHGWDKPMEEPFEFLWDFHNRHTRRFLVNYMCLASGIKRMQGQQGILEEWAAEKGIPLYLMHTDFAGKRYLIGQDGRSVPVKKQWPKHLKLVT